MAEVAGVLKQLSERKKQISAIEEIDRNLTFDVGSLTAWDPESIVMPKAGPQREDYLRKMAQDDTQNLLNKLYSLHDTEIVEGEKVLKLPDPTIILPRAKPIPVQKPPTRWEKFARDKGIKSKSDKKREKLVYDDTTRKWVPRYGYQKVMNEDEKNWLIEIPDQADPNVDYFTQRNEEKKERIAKNKYQQLRNVDRATRPNTKQ